MEALEFCQEQKRNSVPLAVKNTALLGKRSHCDHRCFPQSAFKFPK